MSNVSLLTVLSEIPDKRRKQGIRYSQEKVLALVLIASLAGRVGYRSITRFCKSHEVILSKLLGLKHGVPSHVSMTAIVEQVSPADFERAINKWSVSHYNLGESNSSAEQVISLDGKAIKSSVKNGIEKSQSFIVSVNAFCSNTELVLTSRSYESGKGSEQATLRNIINELALENVVFTADAAHSSKKH